MAQGVYDIGISLAMISFLTRMCVPPLQLILMNESDEICAHGVTAQVRDDCPGPLVAWYRHISKGAWPFSTRDHGWPISDCSAEGLKVLSLHPSPMPHLLTSGQMSHIVMPINSPFFFEHLMPSDVSHTIQRSTLFFYSCMKAP